ncbi:glycosyltransferase [Microbacterium sp. Root553]|uniref:glycosyltransferase n=1 Tax=Microbacterium sp. Root553 TaxID=1736556 RepID=UPI0009EC6310|nr:glycosyltransferase [Microbacterium sp. Root553]
MFERIPPSFSASPRCIPAPPPPSIRVFRALSSARKTSIGTVTAPIRVASIPAAHPYIHAITDPQLVRVLPDPPVPGAPAGQWWPPVAMTPEWLAAHARDYDVLHVHFGLESFSPDQVRAGLDAARLAGRPVIFTVHDLDNPQLIDQAPYRELLDVIVPAADRLVTLTDTAAAEIDRRWQRSSLVVPHPTLTAGTTPPARRRDDGIRVGMHLRDLRPNIDAERAVQAMVDAAQLLDGLELRARFEVLMNERVRDDEAAARVVAAARDGAAVQVRRTPYLSDADVEQWLSGLDLFVLPYRHGTHSGWVELCYDLGVPVAGTDVGHIRSQHPSEFSVIDLDDPRTLVDAVTSARATAAVLPDDGRLARRRSERLAERQAVRDAHARLYSTVMAEVSA